MDHNTRILFTSVDLGDLPSDIMEIGQRIADKHQISIVKLFGKRRDKVSAKARQEAYSEIYALGGYSTTAIGKIFNRDHSTIVYGIKRYKQKCGL